MAAKWAGRAVIVLLSAFLAWSIVVQLAIARLPAPAASRLAPDSPTVQAGLAEIELQAGRYDRAETLARQALARQPFNVNALVIVGLALDHRGEVAAADEILTLAGNWSLGDQRTHLWLFDRRLRAGESASALAHLDALLRSQPDRRRDLFELLQELTLADPAILTATNDRLALAPNWRAPFLAHLGGSDNGRGVATTIAVALHAARKDLTQAETESLLQALLASRDYERLRILAAQIGVGPRPAALIDTDFEGAESPLPFRWNLLGGAGATAEIVADPQTNSKVLRVQYDGYSGDELVRQLILLPAGSYRLTGQAAFDGDEERLRWAVRCLESGVDLQLRNGAAAAGDGETFTEVFDVPAAGCNLQWLHLTTDPTERRSEVIATYDNLTITPLGSSAAR